MESKPPPANGLAPTPWCDHPAWTLVLLALAVWHGWMTLTLFGTGRPWERLLDDEPVLSGRHPLHLYHGYLGARAFYEFGHLCCFDPGFQAGYPKTPVFDGGSRPAELFAILAGGEYRPAGYKIGLAVSCLVVPLLLVLAARGAGMPRGPTCLATAAGLLVWWGGPCREALEAGDLDLLLAAVAAVAQVGFLVRFDRAPGFLSWAGVLITGYCGWFAHPMLFALLLPLALIYYVSVGTRHSLLWHLALLGSLAGAVASNAFWLTDWVNYWWIRAPAQSAGPLLAHRTLGTIWNAPLWGSMPDRTLAVGLLACALVGVFRLNCCRRRPAARLFGLGTLAFLVLAVAGISWEPMGRMGSSRLLLPALLFAVIPAVHGLHEAYLFLAYLLGGGGRAAVAGVGVAAVLGMAFPDQAAPLATRCLRTTPLDIGLGHDREAVVRALERATTADARILWEDRTGREQRSLWTALLPLLTGRSYLGGLDPEADIDYAYPDFTDQVLAGRPIGSWSPEDLDRELERYCHQYNVGWIVCWSPAAVKCLRAWDKATEVAQLHDGGTGHLFAIRRPHSYVLSGQAEWLGADSQRIVLGEVEPENGKLDLSLHYLPGMQVMPSRVRLERRLDPYDPIPFVRLAVSDPVARVTLTWGER